MNQSQPDFSVHCGYDLNGNITSLRRGGSGAYDGLTMGYEGNRLTSVTDCGNDNLLGEVPQLAAGGAASGRWWQPSPYLRGRIPPLPERGYDEDAWTLLVQGHNHYTYFNYYILDADGDCQLSGGIGGGTSIWATASSSALMVA